ncbi:MAG: hypothetical protein RRY78_00500 [Clostridia bacterium]
MKRKTRSTLCVLLMLCMAFTLLTSFSSCALHDKKAMIVIHGIAGGSLYDAKTNQPVYAIESVTPEELGSLIPQLDTMINSLFLNDDGSQTVDLRPATMNDKKGVFGMLNTMKPIYDTLQANFGDEYDVINWTYDWRLDNDVNALELEKLVKKYDKIQLFAHSMGGNLVSRFLLKEENRKKVELFIPFSTPFLGSADTHYFFNECQFANMSSLFNGDIDGLNLDINKLFEKFGSVITNFLTQFRNVAATTYSAYQLTPCPLYYNDPFYDNTNQTVYSENGIYFNHTQIIEKMKTLPLCHTKDGNVRVALDTFDEFKAKEFVEVDGVLKHISTLVNTHYFAGNNVPTLATYDLSDGVATADNYMFGDGLVSIWSGVAGTSVDAANVTLFDGATHLSILSNKNALAKMVQIVKSVNA